MDKDVLYYDGKCPLCRAEIAKLEKRAGPELELVNIHDLPEDADLPPRQEMLESLHMRRRDSEMLTGLDANVAAWQHTRIGFLWRWLRWPLFRPVTDRVYDYWAKVRFQRLYRSDSQQ